MLSYGIKSTVIYNSTPQFLAVEFHFLRRSDNQTLCLLWCYDKKIVRKVSVCSRHLTTPILFLSLFHFERKRKVFVLMRKFIF